MTRYVALTVAMFALVAPPARGGGLPAPGTNAGNAGVTAPDIATRYVTVPVGEHTLIAGIDRESGRIVLERVTRRSLVVPAVTYDYEGTGLSADGQILVLAEPRIRFGRRRSTFVIFDARSLRPRATITVGGDLTLHALSRDGARLYLIRSRLPGRHTMRVYDVAAGRLLPAAPDASIRGYPMARAMSRDGRWAYTVYQGRTPYVHALDTERGEAKRIALDGLGLVDGLTRGRDGSLIVSYDGEVVRTLNARPVARTAVEPGRSLAGVMTGVALLALLGVGAARAGVVRSR